LLCDIAETPEGAWRWSRLRFVNRRNVAECSVDESDLNGVRTNSDIAVTIVLRWQQAHGIDPVLDLVGGEWCFRPLEDTMRSPALILSREPLPGFSS